MKARLFVLALLAAVAACTRHDPHTQEVSAIVEAASAPNTNAGVSSDRWADGLAPVPAEGFPNLPPFGVASRLKALTKFPCLECHNKPLEVLRVTGKKDKKASHWDIRIQHGRQQEMLACNTCHAYDDFALLKTLAGRPVAINHAYQICAQCHSKQANDWAGGAHGKRLAGWAPPRIVQNCAGCHDPHKPKLATRWPALAVDTKDGSHERQQ